MASERLSSMFQPVIFMLYISGLYFPISRPFQCLSLFGTCCALCSFIIGVTLTTLYVSESWMFTISCWKMENSIWLVGQSWMLSNLLFVGLFFSISASRNLPTFLQSLDEYHHKYAAGKLSDRLTKALQIFSSCFPVLVYALIVFSSAYITFFEVVKAFNDFLGCGTQIFGLPTNILVWNSLWLLLSWYYFYIYLMVPAMVYMFVWLALLYQANRFNREFTDHLFDNSADPCKDLEHFRLRHEFLCKLVKEANMFVRHFLCTIYSEGLPVLLIILHSFLYGSLKSHLSYTMLGSAIYLTGQLVIVTLMGTTFCNTVRQRFLLRMCTSFFFGFLKKNGFSFEWIIIYGAFRGV